MIMSPFVLDRNVPLIGPPRGGQIGADGDEQEGVGKGGSAGASAQQAAAGGGCGAADARELPAGEAGVEAVGGGRSRGSEAPEPGGASESCWRGEVAAGGAAAAATARAQGALGGDGADGRQFSLLAGGARSAGLLDGPGR